MEFSSYPKIERLGKMFMHITQKIHGTNAQVLIYKDPEGVLQLLVGSRTRWITPENDNYGFAAHVYAHKQEFIDKLGAGRHFGEWAGPGINSGEGLSEKVFVLFDHWKFPPERALPPKTIVVPVLYKGAMDLSQIDIAMSDLKTNGSKLSPGFMRPEGVVVFWAGVRYKNVFENEDTQWKKGDEKYRAAKDAEKSKGPDMSHLLQPIRLEKLLSKDESYITGFPSTMPIICAEYIKDLAEEGQIANDELTIKNTRKALGSELFKFVKAVCETHS